MNLNDLLAQLKSTQNQPGYANKLQAAMSPQYQGMFQPGNIDLNNRPLVYNPETGGHSTVWSMGIGLDNGKEALIPRVSDEGKILTKEQAINQFKKTKKHLGIFHSADAANNYAQQLHENQAQQYLGKEGER